MNRILCITAFEPNNNTAGQAFTFRLIKDLAQDNLVDLCFFHNSQTPPEVNYTNVTVLFAEQLTFFRRILGVISLPILHPMLTSRFSINKTKYLRSIAHNYDAVYFDFSQIFVYALFIKHHNKFALAHDIITQMYSRRTGLFARLHTLYSKLSEHLLINNINANLYCFSLKDCTLVESYFGVNAEKVDFYLDERIYDIEQDSVVRHSKFVFYGAWGRRENSYGLLWFFREVMPLLDKSCRFVVIGSGVSDEVRGVARQYATDVEFTGFVDNPYPLIAGARALVAPLFEGAGVKVKVLEALACGTPVVGTKISFEGIDEMWLNQCQICSNATEFAETLKKQTSTNMQQARAAFLAGYPRNTMGSVLRMACKKSFLGQSKG